jgi:hypothetical protein
MSKSDWKTLDTAGMLKKESAGMGGVTTTANVGAYAVPLGAPRKPTPLLRRAVPARYETLPTPKKK